MASGRKWRAYDRVSLRAGPGQRSGYILHDEGIQDHISRLDDESMPTLTILIWHMYGSCSEDVFRVGPEIQEQNW